MKRRLTLMACLLLPLLTTAAPAWAQISVRAHVDRTTVAPGESVMLRVSIENGNGQVDVSAIKDFKVLSRGSGSSFQLIDGRMAQEYTYNYLLIPLRQGRLTIPALAVEAKGRRLLTEPITIEAAASAAEKGQAAPADIRVTAEVSNPTPVLGEQITYTFRYYRAVQTDDARFQQPSFEGFAAREIEDRRTYRKTIDGRDHMVTELYYNLTPTAAGKHTIEPAMLQVGVVRRGGRRSRSPFDGIFGRQALDRRVVQTEAIDVQVRPLPAWQGSPPFSGLVGRFDLTAAIESKDLKVGDSATLTVTLQGSGNLMDAREPDLRLPPSLKQYADNPEEKIELTAAGYSGHKIFRTALVPVSAGEIQIPPIRLVYFDTQAGRYHTLEATAPALSVAEADAAAETQVAVSPNPLALAKQRVAFTGRDILPPQESLTALRSKTPLPVWLFTLALVVPALAYGGAVLTQKFRRQEKTPAAMMRARARQALKQAGVHAGDERLGQLYQALTAAIFAAAGRNGEALTWKEAEAILVRQGRSPEQAGEAAALLARIESYKFGAARLAEAEQAALLKQTRKMVRTLVS